MTSERRDAAAHDLTRFTPPTATLTRDQIAIAQRLAQGKLVKQIAGETGFSVSKVEYQIREIARILDLPAEGLSDRDLVLVWAYWTYRAA